MDKRFKPECLLVGQDEDLFMLVGIASRILKKNNLKEQAHIMWERVMESDSYNEALNIIGEYVTIVGDKSQIEM